MKIIGYKRYGLPHVFECVDIDKPTAKRNEVCMKILAATVTSGDCRVRGLNVPSGFGLPARLMLGLNKPRQGLLGTELACVMDSVGSQVAKFKVGEPVFAFSDYAMGCHAQFRCLPQSSPIAPKPINLSFDEAAALSIGGTPALDLLHRSNLKPDEKVLVNCASGGVGTAAVQLAKYFGAEVTAVCSPETQTWFDQSARATSLITAEKISRRTLRASLSAGIACALLALSCPTFAAFATGTGIARVPNLSSGDEGYGIALQGDRKIVVAGRCIDSTATPCVARLNADGTMDTTFNAAGAVPGKRVIDGVSIHTSSFLRSVKVLIAGDGKIVVATTCSLSNRSHMCVARLNADGSFDATFDGPDVANPGNGRFRLEITSSLGEVVSDAALQRIDGRIVLVGQCGSYHCIVRLKSTDGSFDTDSGDFGLVGPSTADRPPADPAANGRFLYRFPSTFNSAGVGDGIAVETTDEGKIVIAGTCGTSALELCLTKFNRDGTFDTDFRGDSLPIGQGGRVRIVTTDESGNAVKQRAADIKMQADGRFLVQCGYFRTSSWSQCMYRVNSGGDVATSFSSGLPFPSEPGRVVYNAIGDALAFAITPGIGEYAQRVVTLGNCDGVGGFNSGTSCVTAIRNGTGAANADGVNDASFVGPNGDQAGTFYFRTRGLTVRNNSTREIVANADGELFIVGECDGQICVYKFRPDGALDTGLCVDDVDGDGKVSASSDGVAIMRSMLGVPTNPNVPAGHGYDIDGDGALNASRDGLLLVRRMLGFADVAVLSGITFAPHARRTTWLDIEAYLRKRCRIPRSQVTAP